MTISKVVTVLVIGCGARGEIYSKYALAHPDLMKVVGVAEPREDYRIPFVQMHSIEKEAIFLDWKEAANKAKMADAVLICTQDNMHLEPAIAFARLGYHILLEKPMSPVETECETIVNEVIKNKVMFTVGHVLRYTTYTKKLKEILGTHIIGDVVSIQHLEPVGYWHQAHSFVRGNWGNTAKSSFMLLAKSCHDVDWLNYLMDTKCIRISSFGNLTHFRKENRPPNAANKCIDCAAESNCPYSAKKIYLGTTPKAKSSTLKILSADPSQENLVKVLERSQYGTCVYDCDNDVVDHQIVNMEFEQGQTVSFTMTAFTPMSDRKTRIFGSHGQIEGDGRYIHVTTFLDDKTQIYDTEADNLSVVSDNPYIKDMAGHGGGDYYLMAHFIDAIRTNDPSKILSGPEQTLASHHMVFKAEESRLNSKVIEL
ncbi:Gfo/Idh/MocA family protein [Thorsellia kenyensis]|uniref:Gfo/Idh/MocA family protein n=1 Tax=Thorsellia kenyensis TaxID=1549888 RepID=A0ABV6CG33_9GAMM